MNHLCVSLRETDQVKTLDTKDDIISMIRSVATIQDGDLTVISDGTIVTYPGRSVDFVFNPQKTLRVKVTFSSTDDEKMGAEVENLQGGGVEIRLKNFNNPLGSGSSKHVPLGNINKRQLFFSYRVFGSKSSKVLHYTFLLGKEVDDGK